MRTPVRIGVLGGGSILAAHGPALARLAGQCTVVAIAEPDSGKAASIRNLLGEKVRIEDDYRKVVSAADVDAVDILLPHHLHVPATLAAAGAGKPILVEKVMARNTAECDRMLEACRRAGVSLTVCQDRRYHPELMAFKDIVASGVLGEIYYWKLDHNQNVVVPEGAWVRDVEKCGGGAVMSCLTHQIDLLRHFGGEVKRVSCMTKTIPSRMQGEAIGVIVAEMCGGALAHLSINWMTRSNNCPNGLWYEMVHVVGSRGEAYWMAEKGTFLMKYEKSDAQCEFVYDANSRESGFTRQACGDWTGHGRCLSEWVKHLRGEDAQVSSFGADVRGTIEVAEAAYRCVQTGQIVTLPHEAALARDDEG
jgi:predicted dehydrogenase